MAFQLDPHNDEFLYALDLLENSERSLFLTGKAGAGETTLVQYFRENTRKKFIVLAPTGVAAGSTPIRRRANAVCGRSVLASADCQRAGLGHFGAVL